MRRRDKPIPSRGLSRMLTQANALWRGGRREESLRLFNEAVRSSPRDVGTLIEASRAFGARYQYDRCTTLLERALDIGRRRADVQQLAGETYQSIGLANEAENCFRRACRLASSPVSQLALATLLERRHRLDEAQVMAAQVLKTEPRSLAAQLLAARVARRRGESQWAEAALRKLISGSSHFPVTVAEALGELATLYDSRGEYDSAWDAILQCKQILLARDAAERKASEFVLARFGRMLDALRPEHFRRWSNADREPTERRLALLTGFPRSGTTLLEQVLDAHPEVVSTEEKDVFSAEVFPQLGAGRPPDAPVEQVLDELWTEEIRAARQFYLQAMEAMLREPIGNRLHLDKNPAMNLMIPAMRRVFPEVKFVIALRDPRDVVLSCFLRYLPLNPVSVNYLTLERTVERYLLDMRAWGQFKPMISSGWVEVRYEDVVADVRREAERITNALELPWDEGVLSYRDRELEKFVNSPSYETVARPIYRTAIGRWRNYERQLEPVLDRLSGIVKELGYPVM